MFIPKFPIADIVNQFMLIVMANFKFKIISKVIADRSATVMPFIICDEQKDLIFMEDVSSTVFV